MKDSHGYGYGERYAHKSIRTLRLRIEDVPGKLGQVTTAIGVQNILIGEIRRMGIDGSYVLREVTVFFDDEEHLKTLLRSLKILPGVKVLDVRDDVLELHTGGKICVQPTVEVKSLSDLQMVYTPGVASVCELIRKCPDKARLYTSIGNSVAIVTNGSAILGLGHIGPVAGMPVMEGKSVLFHILAGVSAFPILIDSNDADVLVDTVVRIAPGFGAVQLEDIAAPLCFEVERRLQEQLDMPVLHDDQHGTAVVALAGLINALKRAGKNKEELKVAMSGAGAAGTAIAHTLVEWGVEDVVVCDRCGAIYKGRAEHMNPYKAQLAEVTNKSKQKGSLAQVMEGKDAFIGVSQPDLVTQDMVRSMAKDPIVFALANPRPEISLTEAKEAGARVAIDGRYMNNALAYPGMFRGALDAKASQITTEMKLAAARAIADQAGGKNLLPGLLDKKTHRAVAAAVKRAWKESIRT